MLVGNKTDLHQERTVSTEEGRKLAESWRAAFLETSAKQNEVSYNNHLVQFIPHRACQYRNSSAETYFHPFKIFKNGIEKYFFYIYSFIGIGLSDFIMLYII